MALDPADIKILASARMTDNTDGGGMPVPTVVQDGLDNNVFPDVTSLDRAFGRCQVRKLYPAVRNTGTDVLMAANMIIEDEPDDGTVHAWALAGVGLTESREDVMSRLQAMHWDAVALPNAMAWATTGAKLKVGNGATAPLAPGHVVFYTLTDGTPVPVLLTSVSTTVDTSGFASTEAGDVIYSVAYDGTWPGAAALQNMTARVGVPAAGTPRLSATAAVQGTLASGATTIDTDSLLVSLVPKAVGPGILPGDAGSMQIDPAKILPAGVAPGFRAGDALVVHHTAMTTAAAASNGGSVNVGRLNLARAVVVDAADAVHLTGYTVNRATGVVTFSNVAGMAQPVRVRHTIEEVVACSRTGQPEVRAGAVTGAGAIQAGPFALSEGLTMYCGRANVSAIRVYAASGQDITNATINYTGGLGLQSDPAFAVNLAAGTATFHSSVSSDPDAARAAFVASHSPVTVVATGSLAVSPTPTLPQATPHRLTLNRALTRDFPAGTLVSSAVLLGDLGAQVGEAFSQQTWGGVWADNRIGSAAAAQYQQATYPITVNNAGAVTERWAIVFDTPTAFRIVGETLGQIGTGSTNTTLSPANPAGGGQPYFTINLLGWGAGWAGGNVLRFNTFGALAPVWVGRVTLPSAPTTAPDSITLAVRGDTNT
jgi:hypothetical protein